MNVPDNELTRKGMDELKRVSDSILSVLHEASGTKEEMMRKLRQGLTEIKQFRLDYPEIKAGAEVERRELPASRGTLGRSR